ncbi:MAG: hypothetical protein U1A22_03590 [Xanthomonadaceae bacterium]|nr:hypothetical protein [Xanthomonadaceae bacterium]
MRVGFLFCARPDQVWHAASVAFEMSMLPTVESVTIHCLDDALVDAVERVAAGWPAHRCRIERLPVPWAIRLADRFLKSWISFTKDATLRFGGSEFRGLDALIVPDLSSLRLKQRLPETAMVFTNHGAGDRARGYDPRIAKFDFVLVAGRKLEQRFIAEGLIRPGHYAMVGYPKFDAVEAVAPTPPRLFANDLPTVLYNPHFEPALSSYQRWGTQVLDYFRLHADRYNLVFAPHLKLFNRSARYRAVLPHRFLDCPNIRVDLDSPALADMTYTRAADIYLGDVSSQVYEFLRRPRPCVFLDPHGIQWQSDPNYAHWRLGRVVTETHALDDALRHALSDHGHYYDIQRSAFTETFDLTGTPSSRRAAVAISDYLTGKAPAAASIEAVDASGCENTPSRGVG